jgi:hypothetical protein
MAQTVCILPPNQQQVAQVTEEVAQQIAQSPVSRSFARAVAGAFVGNIVDRVTDPYDEGGVPIFTMVGALAGTRAGVRMVNTVGRGAKFAVDKVTPRPLQEWMDAGRLKKTQDYLDTYGMTVNANDAESVSGFREAMNGVSAGLVAGKNPIQSLLDSSWVKSMFGELRTIAKNAPVANKIATFLKDIPNQIKQLKGDVQVRYNATHGSQAYERFVQAKALPIARDVLKKVLRNTDLDPSKVSDRELLRQTNDALYRIMDTGLGGDNPQVSRATGAFYADRPWARAFDEELAANKEILDFIEASRDFYTRTAAEFETHALRMVREKADELALLIDNVDNSSVHIDVYRGKVEGLIEDYISSGMSWKGFVNSLDEADHNNLAVVLRALADENGKTNRIVQLFGQIRELQHKVNQMKSLDRAYVPHVEDREKMKVLQNKLIKSGKIRAEGDFRPETKDLPDFEKYVEDEYFKLNYAEDRKLYAEDDSLMDFSVRNYSSGKKARERVNTMLTEKRARGELTIEKYNKAVKNLDNMIKKGTRESKDGSKSFYYVEAPEDMPDLFSTNNREAFKTFSANYRAKNFDIKKSSRLDYQRNLEMPMEFRKTNIYELNNSYANDVAPRLHSMRNGIYDVLDFHTKWITPLQQQLGTSEGSTEALMIAEKLKGIYNTTLRINQFNSVRDMVGFERAGRFANAWRNTMAMAYQYGIGYYNLFEHAVQTPTLTSWRSYLGTLWNFATNPAEANAMANAIVDQKVLEMKLKSQSGNTDMIDDLVGLTWGERMLEGGANLSANFSLTKYLGRGLKYVGLGFDVENTGLFRIAFDGFMGGNAMSTAINAHASMNELRKLTQIYKALEAVPAGQPKVVNMFGANYNIGEVQRKLALLGIDDTNIRGFMDDRTQNFLGSFMENIKAGKQLTSDEINNNKEAFGYLQTVLNTTTENYQATNQFYRPEMSMTPLGRVGYQYSTYGYNQIFQNLQMRIRYPIEDWQRKLPQGLAEKTNMSEVLYYYTTGNFDKLKKTYKLTDEMIESFPADAYTHMFRYFGGAVSVAVLGTMSIDAFRDLLANPFKDDENDHWRRVNRRKIVNIFAPKSEQYTFGDLFDGEVSPDIVHLAQYMAALTIDTGLTSRLDALFSSYERQSLLDLTPVTRAANDAYKDLNRVIRGGLHDFSSTSTDVTMRNLFRYAPVVGASPFSELKGTIQKRINEEPKAPKMRIDGAPILPQAILPR